MKLNYFNGVRLYELIYCPVLSSPHSDNDAKLIGLIKSKNDLEQLKIFKTFYEDPQPGERSFINRYYFTQIC